MLTIYVQARKRLLHRYTDSPDAEQSTSKGKRTQKVVRNAWKQLNFGWNNAGIQIHLYAQKIKCLYVQLKVSRLRFVISSFKVLDI